MIWWAIGPLPTMIARLPNRYRRRRKRCDSERHSRTAGTRTAAKPHIHKTREVDRMYSGTLVPGENGGMAQVMTAMVKSADTATDVWTGSNSSRKWLPSLRL